jgi:hypothetical protein
MESEDYIAQRAHMLMEMAVNVDSITEPKAQDMMYQMMQKLLDSIVVTTTVKKPFGGITEITR